MLRIIVPVFGRPRAFAEALPEIVSRVGCDSTIVAVIDGNPRELWHSVEENEHTATCLQIPSVVLGGHRGNGVAFMYGLAWMHLNGNPSGPVIKVDADVIPSPNYGRILVELAKTTPPDVGCIVGLPRPEIPRHDAGLRRIPFGRVVPLRLALSTPEALAVLGDQTTVEPLGQHDILVARRLAAAKLRTVYTHLAWVDRHIETRDADYEAWAAPYRAARRNPHSTLYHTVAR